MICFACLPDVSQLEVPFEEPSEGTDVLIAPTVHEQEDGTILAVCATGSSSQDSLLSWIRHLEADGNQALADIPILFTLKSPAGEVAPLGSSTDGEENGRLEDKK